MFAQPFAPNLRRTPDRLRLRRQAKSRRRRRVFDFIAARRRVSHCFAWTDCDENDAAHAAPFGSRWIQTRAITERKFLLRTYCRAFRLRCQGRPRNDGNRVHPLRCGHGSVVGSATTMRRLHLAAMSVRYAAGRYP